MCPMPIALLAALVIILNLIHLTREMNIMEMTKEELRQFVLEMIGQGSSASKIKEGGKTGVIDFCPECMRKDQQAEFTRRDYQRELEKATAEAERLRAEASHTRTEADTRVKEALETAQNILAHIENPESCTDPEHCDISKKLGDFRRKTITPKEVGDWIRWARQQEGK